MSSEPQSPARWHDDLAQRDAAARRGLDEHVADAAESLLERRSQVLFEELTVLRAAVARRDDLLRQQTALLRDQTSALQERDDRLRALEEQVVHLRKGRFGVRRFLGRVRRAAGRYVRAGLSQR